MNVAAFSFLLCIHLLLVEGRKSGGTHATGISDTRRILGGKNAIPSDVKWIVRLRVETGSGMAGCTGTLINAFWILTAAHCVHFKHDYCDTVEIYPSGWQLGDPGKVSAAKCFWHPKHDTEEFQFYDIALIETKENLPSAHDLYAVMDLPPPGTRNCAGQDVTFYGFGITDKGAPDAYAPALLEANGRIIKWKDCEEEFKNQTLKDYGSTGRLRWISKQSFCTKGDPSQNLGAVCVGDSGGPVMKKGVLVGVISAALEDTKTGCLQVSLHTNIDAHLRWIWSHVDQTKDTSFMKGLKGSADTLEDISSRK